MFLNQQSCNSNSMEKRRRVHGGQKALVSSAAAVSKLLYYVPRHCKQEKKAPKTFRLDKLKMYETSNVLNRSLCRIILEEKISRAFKMLQNFFDDWRKIEDNIFM